MPLDIPPPAADEIESEPRFIEPQFPGVKSDGWQEALRQIFATEGGMWHRRAIARQLAAAPR